MPALVTRDPRKFRDPRFTASGQRRAHVTLAELETIWFNTGTRCNLVCRNCYIESSPRNDRLAPLKVSEVRETLDEVSRLGRSSIEVGFTGGEPFVNVELVGMLREVLERGHRALVLTNATKPLQRPRIQAALLDLVEWSAQAPGGERRLTFRVSLDHYTQELHDLERGPGSWALAVNGLRWLSQKGFKVSVAGRTCWGEDLAGSRRGYARLFANEGIPVDASSHADLTLFPELDETADVPEITVDCWETLGASPADPMCASSRMIIKRRGADRPVVVACTLLPYDRSFELGSSLADAKSVVMLNHPHCTRFCVLGDASCGDRGGKAGRVGHE